MMQTVALDFETYFDSEYSLSKMTTEAYVRDGRFEAHGVALKLSGIDAAQWYEGAELSEMFECIDWPRTAVLCHHAQFDGLILSHHYGIRPALWLDTLSMARLVVGNHISASLASLAKHFDLGTKDVPYDLFKGRHWSDLSPEVQQRAASGACQDVELTWELFKRLARGFPPNEHRIIDATIRMFTEPALRADRQLLQEVYDREENQKAQRLAALGIEAAGLQSAVKFSRCLEQLGVTPETKAGKNGPIPTFAKTDPFMSELLEHEDERVRALAEARLGIKSTLNQTRARRLMDMSDRGPLCVYLKYCGAHTTRWSGGDKLNFQNFPRSGELRRALRAPEGFHLAKLDMSQIECRILNWAAGQHDKVREFATGADPYVAIASAAYGFPVTREHASERGTGKQLELSCGYGAGAETIQRTAARGTYGPPVVIDLATAMAWRDLYRGTHAGVTRYWRQGERVLSWLARGETGRWGPLEVRDRRIILPNGCPLIYETLEWEEGWRLGTRRGYTKMYGAKLVENVVQAMARVVLSDLISRVLDVGLKIVLTAHDDLGILVKCDEYAETTMQWLLRTAAQQPTWAGGLPLAAEGKLGESYE